MAKFPYLHDPHQALVDTSPVVFVHVVWIEWYYNVTQTLRVSFLPLKSITNSYNSREMRRKQWAAATEDDDRDFAMSYQAVRSGKAYLCVHVILR